MAPSNKINFEFLGSSANEELGGLAGEWKRDLLAASKAMEDCGLLDKLSEPMDVRVKIPGATIPASLQQIASNASVAARGKAASAEAGSLFAAKRNPAFSRLCQASAAAFRFAAGAFGNGPRMETRFTHAFASGPKGERLPAGAARYEKPDPMRRGMVDSRQTLILPINSIGIIEATQAFHCEERPSGEDFRRHTCCHELAHALHVHSAMNSKKATYGEARNPSPLDRLLASDECSLGFAPLIASRFREAFADAAACIAMGAGSPEKTIEWAFRMASWRNSRLHLTVGQDPINADVAHDTREAMLALAAQAWEIPEMPPAKRWELCIEAARRSCASLCFGLLSDSSPLNVNNPDPGESPEVTSRQIMLSMLAAVSGSTPLDKQPSLELRLDETAKTRALAAAKIMEEEHRCAFGFRKTSQSRIDSLFEAMAMPPARIHARAASKN